MKEKIYERFWLAFHEKKSMNDFNLHFMKVKSLWMILIDISWMKEKKSI